MIKSRRSLKYDKITSIEFVGMKQTYDFSIPQTHCFFGNDILVHNSSIKQDAHNIITLWRDKKREEKGENEVVVDFEKVRDDSGYGGKIRFIFNPDSQQYDEKIIKPVQEVSEPEPIKDGDTVSLDDVRDLFNKEEK